MTLTKKHFDYFVNKCEEYQEKFQLNGFNINYIFGKSEENKASCYIDQIIDGIIKIKLNCKLDVKDIYKELDYLAKHEMIHALLGEYTNEATERFTTEDHLYKLSEKLVNKLAKLI